MSLALGADAATASWIPAAFLLSNLIALLPAGRLADLYGRKRLFLTGTLVFALSSILAGLSTSIETLLLFRVLQGIGAAMYFSTGMAIVGGVFRDSGRGAAIGWMISSVYIGLSSGPLVGGWLTDQFGWKSVFFFQTPLALITLLFGILRLKGEWRSDEPHAVDWWGSLLIAAGLCCFFIGGTHLLQPWGQWSLGGSLLLLYLFVHHARRTPWPLVDIGLVSGNLTFRRALLASLFMYSGQYGVVFLMSLYLQYNRELTPTQAGQIMMLQAFMMALTAPLAGRFSDRWGSRPFATIGCLLIASGLMVLSRVDAQMPLPLIIAALMLVGTGHGLFSTPNNAGALGTVPPARLGIASALLNQSRLLGQLLGTAVVSFLMTLYIGNNTITPADFGAFQQLTQVALILSVMFALSAAALSFGMRDRAAQDAPEH